MRTFDSRQHGILALRHDDYEAGGYSLANRSSLLGVEIAGRLVSGRELGTYVYHEDPKVGDLNCATFWPKSTREIHGWAFAWPSRTVKSKGDAPATGTPNTNVVPTGASSIDAGMGGSTESKDSGKTAVLPMLELEADKDFAQKSPRTLRELDENLWPKFPVGHVGITMAGSLAKSQCDLFMPTDPRLIAPHRNGDHWQGSLVCDLNGDMQVDPLYTAPLQSAFRVMRKPTSGPVPFGKRNSVAWNLAMSGLGDSRGGVVVSAGIYALAGADASGPLHVGLREDVHKITTTPDGDPINSLHIHTGALFLDPAASTHDGPINFESDAFPDDVSGGNKKMKVHLQWKEDEKHEHVSGPKAGRWCLWAESAFETHDNPCRPGTGTGRTRTGGGGPGTTETGRPGQPTIESGPGGAGGNPSSGLQPGQVPTLDPHPERIVLPGGGSDTLLPPGFEPPDVTVPPIDPATWGPLGPNQINEGVYQSETPAGGGGSGMSTVSTGMEVECPSTSMTAAPVGSGLRDALVTPDDSGGAFPTIGRTTGYARQDPSTATGYSGTTTTGTPTYTHPPCSGYSLGGTCDGGMATMPGEVRMIDYASSVVSTDAEVPTFTSGIIVSKVYDVKAPGTNYACGIPHLATGGIASGYSWRVRNGALSYYYHDSAGTKDEAVHFTTTQRIGFRSNTDYWGDFAHANTADKVYTFPNLTANVTLNSISGGLGTQYYVPYFGADGALTQDIGFQANGAHIGIGTSPHASMALHMISAQVTDGDSKYQQAIYDTAAYNAWPIAGIFFAGKYNSAGTYAGFGGIQGGKLTAVDGNTKSYLDFTTYLVGTGIDARMRLTTDGLFIGGGTTIGPQQTGVAAAPLEVWASSGAQFRISQTLATNYCDFTVDGSGHLTIAPSGNVVTLGTVAYWGYVPPWCWRPTVDADPLFNWYKADGVTPVFQINSSTPGVAVTGALSVTGAVTLSGLTGPSLLCITSGEVVATDTTALTPQFLRLGLGGAADGTAALKVTGSAMVTTFLNVGTTTDAVAAGDLSAGLTGAASRMFYDQSASELALDGAGDAGGSRLTFGNSANTSNVQFIVDGTTHNFHVDQAWYVGPGTTLLENVLYIVNGAGATAGFVGIGTPSPTTKLHVQSDSTTTVPTFGIANIDTGDAAMRWSLGTTISYALGIDNSVAGDPFVLSTAASGTAVLGTSNLLSITSAGDATLTGTLQATKLGAGTAPSYPLHVIADTSDRVIHCVSSRATGTSYGGVIYMDGASTTNMALWVYADGATSNYSFYGAAGTFYNVGNAFFGGIFIANNSSIFNDLGGDSDSRFEGDTLEYMLFLDASAATENIALLTTASPNWQTMDRGIFIGDVSNAPNANPASGGYLYVVAGALTWRGSSGTVTTLGPA